MSNYDCHSCGWDGNEPLEHCRACGHQSKDGRGFPGDDTAECPECGSFDITDSCPNCEQPYDCGHTGFCEDPYIENCSKLRKETQ